MRFRQRLDPRATHRGKHSTVTITGDKLEIDIDTDAIAKAQADASAQAIAAGIRAIPAQNGHRPFNVTGTLASGIAAQRTSDGVAAVVAPADRLTRDPSLLEKLAELVPALADPTADPRVEAATEQAAADIVKVRR